MIALAVVGIALALCVVVAGFVCAVMIGARKAQGEPYGNGRNRREVQEPAEGPLPPVEERGPGGAEDAPEDPPRPAG